MGTNCINNERFNLEIIQLLGSDPYYFTCILIDVKFINPHQEFFDQVDLNVYNNYLGVAKMTTRDYWLTKAVTLVVLTLVSFGHVVLAAQNVKAAEDVGMSTPSPCERPSQVGVYESIEFNWGTRKFDITDHGGQMQSYDTVSDLLKEHCVVKVTGVFSPFNAQMGQPIEFPDLEELDYFDIDLTNGPRVIRFPKLKRVSYTIRVSDESYPNENTVEVELPSLEEGRLLVGSEISKLEKLILKRSFYESDKSDSGLSPFGRQWLSKNCSIKEEAGDTVEFQCVPKDGFQ